MARKLLLKSPPEKPKVKTLTLEAKTTPSATKLTRPEKNHRLGEVAGGAAAECAAVCCCCPCTVMNLLVLAIIKLPACMCKKAKKRRQQRLSRRRQKKALLDPPSSCGSREDVEKEIQDLSVQKRNMEKSTDDDDNGGNVDLDLEKEMWEQFSRTGFWRSPSQKDE